MVCQLSYKHVPRRLHLPQTVDERRATAVPIPESAISQIHHIPARIEVAVTNRVMFLWIYLRLWRVVRALSSVNTVIISIQRWWMCWK